LGLSAREPLALAPLYDFIDSDALDSLFRSSDGEASVSFTYAEHEVTVHSDGEVTVQ
jgi:hypothetical protein